MTADLHLGAGRLHDVRQHDLAHGLGDDVIGGVGGRPGRDRVFLLLQRLHHVAEHVAFVRRVAQPVGEWLGQLRRRRGHRHHYDAGSFSGRKRHAAFAGTEWPDDRHHLVVLGELAHADHRLLGLACRIERDDLELLAVDAARGVDLFDRHLRGDLIGFGESCEGTRTSEQISKQDFLRLCRLTGNDR